MNSSTWFSTLEIGYLLHKRIFKKKSPKYFSVTFAEACHGVLGRSFWEKFSKNETLYISISRCPDHFAPIFKSWNVLLFMLLIFQICQNLTNPGTEFWHGVFEGNSSKMKLRLYVFRGVLINFRIFSRLETQY